MYDYDLAISGDTSKTEKMFILYGDNGSGKTTILKLVFHLLAPEDNEGHKSIACRIPFEYFEIEFQDNTKVYADRPKGKLRGSFSMGIKSPHQKEKRVEFIANEDDVILPDSKRFNERILEFLNALSMLDISLYMLSDDRTIHFAGRENRIPTFFPYDTELDNERIYSEARLSNRFQPLQQIDLEIIAQRLLKQSIWRVEKWIQGKAMRDSSIGESSITTLYNEILRRIVSQTQDESSDSIATKKSIMKRVKELESQFKEFAQYGFLPEFKGKEILAAVSSAPSSQTNIIMNVLNPYLDSLNKKLEAMAEVYRRVDSFVNIINRFLVNKKLTFNLHSGIAITTKDGTSLEPAMLSSGERHLFLLFCNSLVAVDRPSIIMIDEPEISLNIKWQRTLLNSLLECSGDSSVQYLFATHSIELLAQHRGQVAKLENIQKK
jgi:energy-coupling factor transporter ATP-binding protein EcfA2